MLGNVKVENLMFIDIETVPLAQNFDELSDSMQGLWSKKAAYFLKEGQVASDVYERAGIYAEFGKIVCISVGIALHKEGRLCFRVKSFYGDDEKELLQDFSQMLRHFTSNKDHNLCGHNAREFDFPYIARRLLINGLSLPPVLDVAGKKPWEVKFLDTLDLWKFGDYKHYTSLALLAEIFGIPTPKDDIDGSQVAGVYYNEHDLERIAIYCEKDVLTTAQLLLKLTGGELIDPLNVERVI